MVTLLIPTKNRSDFLIRLLCYYRDLRFQGTIIVGDSSEPVHREKIKKAINLVKVELKTIYSEHPPSSIAECIKNLLKSVSTPYAAVLSDDDFLVPGSLEQCVLFLENTPEYSVAHGAALLFNVSSDRAYGQVAGISPYAQRAVEHETASARLLDHLGTYSPTVFSVHRTDSLLVAYRHVAALKLDNSFAEFLPSSLPVVRGKVKKLDMLYMVRQTHADMTSRKQNLDLFDWICRPEWAQQWAGSRDCLAEELMRQDGISMEEAREVVKQAFWSYLAKGIMTRQQSRYTLNGSGLFPKLRGLSRRVPGLRSTWHKVRSFLPGEDNQMSLQALLRPSSPYHADFMPIYRAITTPVPELNELRPE